jgi:hypothetical protein
MDHHAKGRIMGTVFLVASLCLGLVSITSVGVESAGAANVRQHWTLSLSNADSSAVDCPSTTTCYAVGATLQATSDSGNEWTTSSIPTTAEALTGISCPSVSICYVIGYDLYEYQTDPMPEYSETGVAYQVSFSTAEPTWTQEALPLPEGDYTMPSFSMISCPSTDACYVASEGTQTANQAAFYSTADGGTSWSDLSIPSGIGEMNALTCPPTASDTTCYAVDKVGETLDVTTDGGTHWTVVPSPYPDGGLTDIACPSATYCVASQFESVLVTSDGGTTWKLHKLAQADKTHSVLWGISCFTVDNCDAVGVNGETDEGFAAVTTNGGSAWKSLRTPSESRQYSLEQVSCSGVDECFAAGLYILSTVAASRSR